MLEKIKSIFYIFPFRLLLNHLKENFVLLLSWIAFYLMIVGKFGESYGIPILFLDPEYLGVVGYFSFQIVGICFGAFYMTWNLVSYLLYSFRYPFVASLKWPVSMFTFNNSIIPFLFLLAYVRQIYIYQTLEMGKDITQFLWMILGLLAGFSLVILITSVYFVITNKNIFVFINKDNSDFTSSKDKWENLDGQSLADRVDFYITRRFRFRPVRDVTHYDESLLKKVFLQHHFNAFLVIILNTIVLIGLGFIIDNPLFELPAAASIFLFFSLIISLAGLIYYWAGKWGSFALIAIILIINSLSSYDWMQSDCQAYGLDYSTEQEYSLEVLNELCHADTVEKDILTTLKILNKWKEKNKEGKPYYYKPKMVIVLASGGGSRSATYTMKIIQTLDSLSNGELMQHTALMTGASGGMMGLGYYRELYLRNQLGIVNDLYNAKYTRNISKDLINKITTTIVSNDLFFGFKKFEYSGKKYNFDRGTSFEIGLNNHTESVLDKSISDYKAFEQSSSIPMLFLSTTNVNDGRKFVISPLNVSYMMRAYSDDDPKNIGNFEVDAIDFRAFFKHNDADSLRMTSALRMNATYPLILPNVSLPSQPKLDVFDAGIRDNFGIENASRFINVFQDWIETNTSGVVIVQLRSSLKNNVIEDYEYQAFLSKLGSSFGSISANLTITQDYLHDYMIEGLDDAIKSKIEIVHFEYTPLENDKRASMSLRLSEKEYQQVVQSALSQKNKEKFEHVIELLK